MRVFSSGGGVQSTAALILAAQGKIDFKHFVFANTGDDSEHPETLKYVREVAMPYAQEHGIHFVEIAKGGHTLRERILSTQRSVPIPARMSNGAPGRRACTVDFKIRQVDRWISNHGGKDANLVTVGLGISTDEIHRAKRNDREFVQRGKFWKRKTYPLIELGMNRSDCQRIIAEAGLSPAPRSACYFCPFHSPIEWQRIRRETPELFADSVQIERHLNWKREALMQKDKVWLHPALVPLDQAVGQQMVFDDLENCESGFCMT